MEEMRRMLSKQLGGAADRVAQSMPAQMMAGFGQRMMDELEPIASGTQGALNDFVNPHPMMGGMNAYGALPRWQNQGRLAQALGGR